MSTLTQNTDALMREKYRALARGCSWTPTDRSGVAPSSAARRTSLGRTRTANRAAVVFFLRCNKRNFTGPVSLRPPGSGSPTTRRPVGTKFEFERFVAPNLQKAIAMWRLDARRSHFRNAFIDGDGAARVAVTSGAINQHIAALSKTGPAELPARTRELVNEAPWRRECVITGLHRFVGQRRLSPKHNGAAGDPPSGALTRAVGALGFDEARDISPAPM